MIPHLSTELARSDLASQFGMGWGACQLGMAECACPTCVQVFQSHRNKALPRLRSPPIIILRPIHAEDPQRCVPRPFRYHRALRFQWIEDLGKKLYNFCRISALKMASQMPPHHLANQYLDMGQKSRRCRTEGTIGTGEFRGYFL